MKKQPSSVKTPAPDPAAEAAESLACLFAPADSSNAPPAGRDTVAPGRVSIAAELDALHALATRLTLDDDLRAKIEDSFSEARVAASLPRPNRDGVGEALNRALKTARRADDFHAIVEPARPHAERAVAWLGREWQRILAVV